MVGLSKAQRVVLVDLLRRGGTSQVYRKVKGMAPTPKPHKSVTDTPWVCQTSTLQPRQLTSQQGTSSPGWGNRES